MGNTESPASETNVWQRRLCVGLLCCVGIAQSAELSSQQRAKKRDFDASLTIPCAQVQGQSLGECVAKIARNASGDATVVVKFSNGFSRSLYFMEGTFLRANATMSGVGTDIEWRLESGVYLIRVDDQRFELPEIFINGVPKQ